MNRRITQKLSGLLVALLALATTADLIEADPIYSRPTVLATAEAKVSGERVTLADVARIHATEQSDATVVQTLERIFLTEAPAPQQTKELGGLQILSAIEQAGIKLESIGYSVPEKISIRREGRYPEKTELLQAAEAALRGTDANASIKVHDIQFSAAPVIPIGSAEYKVQSLGEATAGRIPVRIEVAVEKKPAGSFLASVLADSWKAVPVVTESLSRGRLIEDADLQLLPVNLFQNPNDIVMRSEDLVGKRVTNTIAAGQPVRKSAIDVPPMVASGKRVQIVYDNGALRATATGLALQDGFEGGIIKVRNENSQRVVRGRIVSASEVEVQVQ